jgi:hypothetical protein
MNAKSVAMSLLLWRRRGKGYQIFLSGNVKNAGAEN